MTFAGQFSASLVQGGGRYALLAGLFFLLLYRVGGDRWLAAKIQARWPGRADLVREIAYSASSVLVFALVEAWLFTSPWVAAHSRLYHDPAAHGWLWFALGFPVMFLVHDTWFYWTHRLMHLPGIYEHVHAVHHRSGNPTPFAAYAVHPIEAFVDVGVFVVILFAVPCHPAHLVVFALGMVAHNVYGHCGYELYPRRQPDLPVLRWVNTSVCHNLHHQGGRAHFGFYFQGWDRLMGTAHPDCRAIYEDVSARRRAVRGTPEGEGALRRPWGVRVRSALAGLAGGGLVAAMVVDHGARASWEPAWDGRAAGLPVLDRRPRADGTWQLEPAEDWPDELVAAWDRCAALELVRVRYAPWFAPSMQGCAGGGTGWRWDEATAELRLAASDGHHLVMSPDQGLSLRPGPL